MARRRVVSCGFFCSLSQLFKLSWAAWWRAHASTTDLARLEQEEPYLGLTVHPGVVVAEVQPGSPAEAAGLARGDVIQSANGTPVLAGEQIRQAMLWEQLRRAVQAEQIGGLAAAETELSLEVSRSGHVREVKVPLPVGQQPPLSA